IISIVIGLVLGFVVMVIEKRYPTKTAKMDSFVLNILVFFVLYTLVIIQMFRRKKWARIIFTLIVAASIITEITDLISGNLSFSNKQVQIIIDIVIVYLLFRKDSNEWYNFKPGQVNENL